ncbi:hypothetical protein [Herbiconiux sp. UC225_62]|uniref:hypothetical protein n=1 Tax=Herbiconiux sp. UC225_62 TaxID=3350168 RepID=UPI0036D3E095
MGLVLNQEVITVSTLGKGVDGARDQLMRAIAPYAKARIISISHAKIENPIGKGQIGTEIVAVIEYDHAATKAARA